MRVNIVTLRGVWGAIALGTFGVACNGDDDFPRPEPETQDEWSWVERSEGAALLSVHGTASDDVWFSGADDGAGPLVLHFDGAEWKRHETGTRSDLWWVHALEDGPVFFGGSDATVLRYEGGAFERLPTPGLGKHTVFGVWAAAADDVYAVGARAGQNGFIWHYDGERFEDIALPAGLPEDEYRDQPGLLKVWGASASEVWVVGGNGVVLRGNAEDGFSLVQSGGDETLFTVHCTKDKLAIVGGTSDGTLLTTDGGELVERTPERAPLLQGVSVTEDGTVWAVGQGGAIYRSRGDEFEAVDPGLDFGAAESLHSVWVDEKGGVWAAGGDVLTPELDQGLALHLGAPVPLMEIAKPEPPAPVCPPNLVDPEPDASIARRWDEQLLNAIRRDVPRPTVHARNLFHFSIAAWDAFSAYDSDTKGYLVDEKLAADDIDAARTEAISYAAYRVLSHRYAPAVGGTVSQACFDAFMDTLGFDPSDTTQEGDGPRALGNRIGAAIIAEFAEDGANELENYADPDGFEPDNPYLVVDRPGTEVRDPTVWQKLVLAEAETQNGIPASAGAQPYIGGHWGDVTPFALERPADGEPYLDIGNPPLELDEPLVEATVEIIQRSAALDVEDDTMIDLSPGAMGNNPLGTNDGAGFAENPVTGEPYDPVMVRRSDFGRVLAEFWADGPTSETPPGHWNTMANDVSDTPGFERRLFGEGDEVSPLEWDVHVYFALNGAVHDAAIAAWELKREYVTARPITLVRYMAGLGQRTDPQGPSYHADGLPLVDGLIELITETSSAKGERHEHLARFVGEIAIRAWRGEPGDRKQEVGGVDYVRALEWMPYQRRTFVTPAFPGYVSGHSTFSRSAAVVMAGITGSEYFPGGYASYEFQPGYLFFEQGPSAPVRLGWATYYDAADQAGQSRVWGGIHVNHDDFDGRRAGARVGEAALAKARTFFTRE
jgi:photosystem II stability/assembly factor-like uncharacterized protein